MYRSQFPGATGILAGSRARLPAGSRPIASFPGEPRNASAATLFRVEPDVMAAIEPHKDLETLLDLARRLSERELFEESAELFLVALKLDPGNLGIKLGLAEVRKRQAARQGRPPRSLREMMREQARRNAIDSEQFVGLAHL